MTRSGGGRPARTSETCGRRTASRRRGAARQRLGRNPVRVADGEGGGVGVGVLVHPNETARDAGRRQPGADRASRACRPGQARPFVASKGMRDPGASSPIPILRGSPRQSPLVDWVDWVDWVYWVEIWFIGWSADLRAERPPQWIHILRITASAPLDQRVNDHGALA